jgi:hypothetical protein
LSYIGFQTGQVLGLFLPIKRRIVIDLLVKTELHHKRNRIRSRQPNDESVRTSTTVSDGQLHDALSEGRHIRLLQLVYLKKRTYPTTSVEPTIFEIDEAPPFRAL